MRIDTLHVAGTYLIQPRIFPDDRGSFLELYSEPAFQQTVGHPFTAAQVNCSISRKGTVRGLHAIALGPGQARYVTCVSGSIVDIVVDVRVGSPTFGEHVRVVLDDKSRHALYLAEGLAHGFAPVTEEATVVYLCSSTYKPGKEIRVHPLDPEIALPWPDLDQVILSEKDAAAPSLRESMDRGLLPDYAQCRDLYDRLRLAGGADPVAHDSLD
ncbi:dTDP-4-dehydrorhamnose 3,5-epimerase family protein [Amycolatopsis sp. lyj-90]|uniref:dTDP-4-dehydrorhamnose 3,5-epimerase family protein n=1 Tax=Amycolatopsis sp. lyj-90 TaxID=2789285 RepID=UPI00397AE2E2